MASEETGRLLNEMKALMEKKELDKARVWILARPPVKCNECHKMFKLLPEGRNLIVETWKDPQSGEWVEKPNGHRCYMCDECIAEQREDETAWAALTDKERSDILAAFKIELDRAREAAGDDPDACWILQPPPVK
jgi:hypothetical protein